MSSVQKHRCTPKLWWPLAFAHAAARSVAGMLAMIDALVRTPASKQPMVRSTVWSENPKSSALRMIRTAGPQVKELSPSAGRSRPTEGALPALSRIGTLITIGKLADFSSLACLRSRSIPSWTMGHCHLLGR